MSDVCIVSRDPRFAQLLLLTAEECGHRVTVTDKEEDLPAASFYLIDADEFSVRPDRGRVILYGRTVKERPLYSEEDGRVLLWHRPFSLAHLTAVLQNLPAEQGLMLMEKERSVLLDGRVIPLTGREYALLSCLYARRGSPVPREVILREVWGDGGDDGLLQVYLHYLRKKLESDGRRRILSVRGEGYALGEEEA